MAAYLVWGALTIYWKLLDGFGAAELVAWRIITAATLMAALLTATSRWAHLRPVVRDRCVLARVVAAAVLLTANWSAYVWAVVHGHVIQTALGYFMSPLGTMVVGVAVFHERLSGRQRAAVALAVCAVVVVTLSAGAVPWVALVLAGSWSVYGMLKRQVPLTPVESMSAESFVVLLPAIGAAALLAGRDGSVPASASPGELALVGLTGVATVVPLMLFAWAAQRVPFTVLGPLQYLIPTVNFLLGWLVFHEDLPPTRVAGFALVWAALVLITIDLVSDERAERRRTGPGGSRPSSRDRARERV